MRTAIAILFVLGHAAEGRAAEFAPAERYEWSVRPQAFTWEVMASGGLALSAYRIGVDLRLICSYMDSGEGEMVDLRPIAFDAEGRRYEFDKGSSVTTGPLTMFSMLLPGERLAADRVARIGVEKPSRGALREIALSAFEQLKSKGVGAFPLPVPGTDYTFSVTSSDGTQLDSKTFRGKIVVLDFWATWCDPCMDAMEEMKAIYDEFRGEGVEFIGVNMDFVAISPEKLTELGTKWPNVLAPTDEADRALWEKAAGVRNIPRAVILDREGWVTEDLVGFTPTTLRAALEKLIEQDK